MHDVINTWCFRYFQLWKPYKVCTLTLDPRLPSPRNDFQWAVTQKDTCRVKCQLRQEPQECALQPEQFLPLAGCSPEAMGVEGSLTVIRSVSKPCLCYA